MFCNQTKDNLIITHSLKLSDITSIYKNKGSRLSLDYEHGILSVVKLCSIIDNLVHNDMYEGMDEMMSDSNVGTRRRRNIRDNLYVIYSQMADVMVTGEKDDLSLMIWQSVLTPCGGRKPFMTCGTKISNMTN